MLQLNGTTTTLLVAGGLDTSDPSGNLLRTVEMYTGTQWEIMEKRLKGDFHNGGAVVIPN